MGPEGDHDGKGVVRGGNFTSDPSSLRTTARRLLSPTERVNTTGFRCAADATSVGMTSPDALSKALSRKHPQRPPRRWSRKPHLDLR